MTDLVVEPNFRDVFLFLLPVGKQELRNIRLKLSRVKYSYRNVVLA